MKTVNLLKLSGSALEASAIAAGKKLRSQWSSVLWFSDGQLHRYQREFGISSGQNGGFGFCSQAAKLAAENKGYIYIDKT
jgi:hypothetical protein